MVVGDDIEVISILATSFFFFLWKYISAFCFKKICLYHKQNAYVTY